MRWSVSSRHGFSFTGRSAVCYLIGQSSVFVVASDRNMRYH